MSQTVFNENDFIKRVPKKILENMYHVSMNRNI